MIARPAGIFKTSPAIGNSCPPPWGSAYKLGGATGACPISRLATAGCAGPTSNSAGTGHAPKLGSLAGPCASSRTAGAGSIPSGAGAGPRAGWSAAAASMARGGWPPSGACRGVPGRSISLVHRLKSHSTKLTRVLSCFHRRGSNEYTPSIP
jgi:hypothetical protein